MAKHRILVIEDDAETRLALKVRFESAGYDVSFSADAATALIQARKASPDLILLDLGIPCGDGFLVLERMQRIPELEGIPVIVLTARDPAAAKQKALSAGASEFFQKPVDNDELLRAIEGLLVGSAS